MRHSISIVLAAGGLAAAGPAQALTRQQQACVESGTSQTLHDGLADETLGNSGQSAAFDAFVARARQCARETGVPAEKHDAYAFFAVANSMRETCYRRLTDAGYPTSTLDSAIDALVSRQGPPEQFFGMSGVSDEGLRFMAIFFAGAGKDFYPKDDKTLRMFSAYLGVLGHIVAVHPQLFAR